MRSWLRRWQRADAELRPRLDALLAGQPHLCGPTVARTVWTSLGGDDVLVAGSSNPVRDLDLAPVTAEGTEATLDKWNSADDGPEQDENCSGCPTSARV